MSQLEEKLKSLDIILPDPKAPVGAYVATKIVGKLLVISVPTAPIVIGNPVAVTVNAVVVAKGDILGADKKDKGEYISKEYHATKFFRTFNLPENVVLDEVHAKVENGITILFLPKVTPTKKKSGSRTVDIA